MSEAPLTLVTGASGYVGGRLVPELERRGRRVRCLARRPEYVQPRVGAGTEVVAGDLMDAASLEAALAGVDAACYLVGRTVGTERWRWMRTAPVRRALAWARGRLDAGTATVLFTARFVPFARLAINLVAGASRIHPPRYLALVSLAALGWAAYQAVLGAVIAAIVPGGPVVAVVVSIVVALALGAMIDLLTRRSRG